MMNFKRGGNPYVKLGVGHTAIVKNWFIENNKSNASYHVDYEGKDIVIDIEGDLILDKMPEFEWVVKINVSGYLRFLK